MRQISNNFAISGSDSEDLGNHFENSKDHFENFGNDI